MYRLLIADDEALEREGLEMMVNHMLPDTFRIFHAANGRKAIQLAEEIRPDIIFMDIKMPGIQGLDAIREIVSRDPHTRIILVTAYDHFAYAKEAVALGVKEYILKPAKKQEIKDILHKMLHELGREKNKRSSELELREKLSQLLPLAESELTVMIMLGYAQDIDMQHLAGLLDYKWERGCAIVLSFPQQQKGGTLPGWEPRTFLEDLKHFLKPQLACAISPVLQGHCSIFLPFPADLSQETCHEKALQWSKNLQTWIAQKYGLKVQTGIGSLQEGIDGLRRSYREALKNSGYAMHADPLSHVEQAVEAMNVGILHQVQGRGQTKVIERVLSFIHEHFQEDITMEQAAEHVNLSPFYFSKMFKLHSGETFIDYLTRLRIERAKRLIANLELSLKEICFEVGYKDPNYFSRVFKKVTGLTPTEYRQKRL
ncbi:response regulator [Brevibacillus migulae]|uniref:response regulator n=1 Tax=Brevibacillus migulae TaxID=1644114 RepID=UPI00106ED486|nr:helix-turn-helix domain-containing protein [Brevibacillus migulae]